MEEAHAWEKTFIFQKTLPTFCSPPWFPVYALDVRLKHLAPVAAPASLSRMSLVFLEL